MINKIEDINNITGLKIGEITNIGNCKTYKENAEVIYDEKTLNFHLLPEENGKFEDYSKCIRRKRNDLVKLLSNKLNEAGINWIMETFGSKGNVKNLKAKTNGHYSFGGNLFSCIRIRVNGILYDINFNRFYIEEGYVNCKLFVPQFSCSKCNPGYPNSAKSEEYSFGIVYYNPRNSFDNDQELIDEFIDFIKYKSKELLR